jgi:hypothetical protein
MAHNFRTIAAFSALLVFIMGMSTSAERRSPITTSRISCPGYHSPPSTSLSLTKPQSSTPSSANDGAIELLIAYTPKVLAKLGSETALLEEIGRIMAYANAAHKNSGSSISFSVVKILALSSDSTDNFSQDLQSATFQDGVWDELLTAREEVSADAVSVLVDGSQRGTLCGLAWTNGVAGTFEDHANFMFSVVSVSGTCTRDTLVHELGHNLGSVHARVDRGGAGSQPFSYGYRFLGTSGQGWHTIMAIPGTDRLIPYFSTPIKTYDGVPIGNNETEDNVRSMSLAYSPVARLYSSQGLPNLTLIPPAEVSQVRVAYTRMQNRKQIKITASPLISNKKAAFQPLEIYFSKGRKGSFRLRAAGRSTAKGLFTLTESITFPSGFFYRVCYPGYSERQLCSAAVDLTKLK